MIGDIPTPRSGYPECSRENEWRADVPCADRLAELEQLGGNTDPEPENADAPQSAPAAPVVRSVGRRRNGRGAFRRSFRDSRTRSKPAACARDHALRKAEIIIENDIITREALRAADGADRRYRPERLRRNTKWPLPNGAAPRNPQANPPSRPEAVGREYPIRRDGRTA